MAMTRALSSIVWLALAAALGSALVGCTDVGDNTYVPGDDGGSAFSADGASDDATVSADGPQADGTQMEGATDVAKDMTVDMAATEAGAGSDASTTTMDGQSAADALGATGAGEAGNDVAVPPGTEAGADAEVDAGTDSPSDSGADVELDTGAEATEDAMIDAGADVLTEAQADANDAAADAESDALEAGGASDAGDPQKQCNALLAMNQATFYNRTNTCSPTELAVYEKTVAGQDAGACLGCGFTGNCLDDTFLPVDINRECEDMPNTSDAGDPNATSECLATLACDLGEQAGGAVGMSPVQGVVVNTYCGVGVTTSQCEASSTPAPPNGPQGVCFSQQTAGFPAGFTSAQVVAHFGDNSNPSGMANELVSCLVSNCEMQCGLQP